MAERRDGSVLITVTGELDVHTRLLLARSLGRHEQQRVVLDLSAVDFADTAGLNAIIASVANASRAGGSVEIVDVSPAVRRLLRLTNAGAAILPKVS